MRYPAAAMEVPGDLQHAGIKFSYDPKAGFYRPVNLGVGVDVATPPPASEMFPAVTAALMMCRKDEFLSLGGFDEGYQYGYEDVDLAHANNGGACPDCGGPVEHEGGCCVCHVCGFSECA